MYDVISNDDDVMPLCMQQAHFLTTSGFCESFSRRKHESRIGSNLSNEEGEGGTRDVRFVELTNFQGAKCDMVHEYIMKA